jgi:hypothetical protein
MPNRKELIKKLKDRNRARPFGMLSEEEQKILRQANETKAVMLYNGSGWESARWFFTSPQLTYILKPDYEPEPEYEDRVGSSASL